jgi:hypothetical protein
MYNVPFVVLLIVVNVLKAEELVPSVALVVTRPVGTLPVEHASAVSKVAQYWNSIDWIAVLVGTVKSNRWSTVPPGSEPPTGVVAEGSV